MFVKFPSIEQFRTVVRYVLHQFQDDAKPVLTFHGTVKLHGTNAAVCHNATDGLWFQSRKMIITPEKDNAGFAKFADERRDTFTRIIREIREKTGHMENSTVCLFGEWCGGNIQPGVALSQCLKMFVIFGCLIVTPSDPAISPIIEGVTPEPVSTWLSREVLAQYHDNDSMIYNIMQFKTWNIDIDFTLPQLVQNTLSDITLAVEKECPVGKHFGISGCGEGVVWTCNAGGTNFRFKVKGEEHSVTKVRKLARVDTEKLEGVHEFVKSTVTENRLSQGLDELFRLPGVTPTPKDTGTFIRWVVNDILKEESDTITQNNLDQKQITKLISHRSREWFVTHF